MLEGTGTPDEERHGSWARRPWVTLQRGQDTEVWSDMLCSVRLEEDRSLDARSLARLGELGLVLD